MVTLYRVSYTRISIEFAIYSVLSHRQSPVSVDLTLYLLRREEMSVMPILGPFFFNSTILPSYMSSFYSLYCLYTRRGPDNISFPCTQRVYIQIRFSYF